MVFGDVVFMFVNYCFVFIWFYGIDVDCVVVFYLVVSEVDVIFVVMVLVSDCFLFWLIW